MIKTFKLDNGEELKLDTSAPMFQAFESAMKLIGVHKADESFFGARQLEFIRQKIYKPTYAELKLLNGGLLPINTSIPEGAESDTYDILDGVGEADVIADFADDIKTVEISGEEVTNKIKSIATSYIYSVQDLRRDRMLGNVARSSVENKALVARRTLDQKIDAMLRVGDTRYGIRGMFNAASVPSTAAAATGTGSTTTWSTKTAANILADIETAINAMLDATNGTEIPNTMLVDATNYHLIKKKALDTTYYSGMTVLKYIEQEYNLKVEWVQQLKNAFVNGTKSGFVLYNNAQDKLEGVLPIRLMAHAPQIKNLTTKNILEARCGGVRVFFPYSMSYTTGI
jgi:hypothetical protein